MKIKIMYPNNKGKIELTKEELEKLLNESYSEGYSDGYKSYHSISIPSYPYSPYAPYYSITCNSDDSCISTSISCTSNDSYYASTDLHISNCTSNDAYASTLTACTTNPSNVAILNDCVKTDDSLTTNKTKEIEICNVAGIGVMKTNEV